MIEFMISDNAKELIKNEDKLREKLADCFGELENAVIINELCEAAKYYTNDAKSNIARYSFRFSDFCFPTLLFSFFSYAFRSIWFKAGIFFAIFILSMLFIMFNIDKSSLFDYAISYFIISIIAAATYRFYLLKEFFTKYELMPVSKLRARKIVNILIAIGVVIVVAVILKLIFIFLVGVAVTSAIHSFGYRGL